MPASLHETTPCDHLFFFFSTFFFFFFFFFGGQESKQTAERDVLREVELEEALFDAVVHKDVEAVRGESGEVFRGRIGTKTRADGRSELNVVQEEFRKVLRLGPLDRALHAVGCLWGLVLV